MTHTLDWCVAKSFWVLFFFLTHYALGVSFFQLKYVYKRTMSSHYNINNKLENNHIQGKVKVTDLLNRLNEEKKIEKKRNLALGVAAVSAVTVFGIILTI